MEDLRRRDHHILPLVQLLGRARDARTELRVAIAQLQERGHAERSGEAGGQVELAEDSEGLDQVAPRDRRIVRLPAARRREPGRRGAGRAAGTTASWSS